MSWLSGVALALTLCGSASAGWVGWQWTFDEVGFGEGRYEPEVSAGVAHYVLEHGYIANLQQEFAPVRTAEYPFFGIRARSVRGGVYVKFRIDGQWQGRWVISRWGSSAYGTEFVDVRAYGEEVSGVWLNSGSGVDGAEWLLDWMGFVSQEDPLSVRIVTPGGVSEPGGGRSVALTVDNQLGRDVSLRAVARALPPGGEILGAQPMGLKRATDAWAAFRVEGVGEGDRYDLSIVDWEDGTVYWQGVLEVPPVLEARMAAPAYRGSVYASGGQGTLRVAYKANVLPIGGELTLEGALLRGETVLASGADEAHPGGEVAGEVVIPAGELAPGRYVVELQARQADKLFGKQRLPLTVHEPHPNEVWVDEDLNFRVNGEPFLPVGFYSVPREHLAKVAKAGFTAVLTYDSNTQRLGEYLDEAERVGLKAVVHSPGLWFGKDGEEKLREAVAALRDKPALLGWYLVDEPSTGREGTTPEDLKRLYAFMQEQDPYHPTFTVYCVPGEFELYRDTHDVFMCDPYPVGHAPLTYVAQWTELGKRAMAGRKPVVIVPQSFGSEEGPQTQWRMPTAKEERCMGYLALVHGARGLFYYRFDVQEHVPELAAAGKWPWRRIGYMPELRADTWAGFERLGPELGRLAPVMLSPEPEMAVAVSPEQPELHTALREHEGKLYLIAVNPHEEALEATVRIEGLEAQRARRVLAEAEVELEDGALGDRFEPYAVHMYTLE